MTVKLDFGETKKPKKSEIRGANPDFIIIDETCNIEFIDADYDELVSAFENMAKTVRISTPKNKYKDEELLNPTVFTGGW